MGFITTKHSLLPTIVVLLSGLVLLTPPTTTSAADLTTLVYRGCANQTYLNRPGFQETLTALFTSLISKSSTVKFFKTTSGSGQASITGLYQCRGDLSGSDCSNCVNRLPTVSDRVCGKTVAARVQLTGCYLHYEMAGFQQVSGTEMLYHVCSSGQAAGAGFEERRDTAFSQVQTGVGGGSGFYATSYGSVFVVAQCEGDLGVGDCGDCVKEAVQKAQVECGSSISGQVYLDRCYVSYNYYPNGVSPKSSSGSGQPTGKTVAIVIGGAAAVGFVIICLLFIRSLMKKHDDY